MLFYAIGLLRGPLRCYVGVLLADRSEYARVAAFYADPADFRRVSCAETVWAALRAQVAHTTIKCMHCRSNGSCTVLV